MMIDISNSGIDLFSFFEQTPDLVCVADKDGFFKKIAPSVIESLGYTEEELYSNLISSFIHPDDKALTQAHRELLMEGKVLHNFINRYITKSGKIIWLEWTSIYFAESEVVFAVGRNITKRKQAQKEVEDNYRKFRKLANHFKNMVEKDRKNFAYDLHEELAQLAAVVKLDVEWMLNNINGIDEESKKRINHASIASQLLIKKIQKISFSLSPNMLDFFGLDVTLEWLCEEFSVLNGIPCNYEGLYNESKLTQEMKVDFFRICQESLTNVIDHSKASGVTISIEEIKQEIHLKIADEGKGFVIDEETQNAILARVRGRVASLNGQLTLPNKRSSGAGVEVIVANEK
ncbi:MAG: PAS domain S-box protein [Bacteroidota bacterium]|nr:PAS domain S-box protein [Bacteroidota bacterium]